MRILFMLIFTCTLQFTAANAGVQDVRVKVVSNDLSVKQLLVEIERQTEFLVLFRSNDVDVSRMVHLKSKSGEVAALLEEAFRNTDVRYEFRNKYIVLSRSEQAETTVTQQTGKRLTGTVTDAAGEPVIGANIVEKGAVANGTITDVDGNFSLNVQPGATLTVSFIGYVTQEIATGSRSELKITLAEDSKALDEVVVIGYGTARKKDVTGSVVRADLNKLQESPNISIGQSLQGTVAGLNAGGVTEAGKDPEITIRGRNSISGGTSPLIVLDGIIYRGALVDINPNDIESIDILKDASAAAIYGSQASNGVILVTSKSVKAMSKPIIEYSGYYTLQESTNDKMRPMNREGFLQLIADCFFDESRMGEDLLQPNPAWDVTKHLMDPNALNGYLNGTDTDWYGMGSNDNPYITSHNLSVRGRSE
ncbi:MAG: carboxypeptidase-like regulatory domain-containing protein, partial [Tannerella sp.]|nr:carboxypeptidase-like regulatory domain-containing protein [Tannerella sp.]